MEIVWRYDSSLCSKGDCSSLSVTAVKSWLLTCQLGYLPSKHCLCVRKRSWERDPVQGAFLPLGPRRVPSIITRCGISMIWFTYAVKAEVHLPRKSIQFVVEALIPSHCKMWRSDYGLVCPILLYYIYGTNDLADRLCLSGLFGGALSLTYGQVCLGHVRSLHS